MPSHKLLLKSLFPPLVMLFLCTVPACAAVGTEMVPGSVFKDCPECPDLVVIPAGSFRMGVADDPSEVPVHRVTLNYRFAIGQTEVTEAQFRFFLQRTGYNAGPSHGTASFPPKRPAVEVDWYAASAYVRWLSRFTGQSYRLPSEAEWDYAAHAGTSTRFWWGNSAVDGCGKEYLSVSFMPYDQQCASSQTVDTIDVASLSANPWGLYDMLGNAGEWMQDCPPDDASAYIGAPADGMPFMGCSQIDSSRVRRGPNTGEKNPAPRVTFLGPTFHAGNIGFRIVRELP